MFNVALVELRRPGCKLEERGKALGADRHGDRGKARLAALSLLVLMAGCTSKPKPPPGIIPSVEVGAPLKSDVWKQVATDADEDRIARLGLAWQEALAEARKTNESDIRREAVLLRPRTSLPRPAPTP